MTTKQRQLFDLLLCISAANSKRRIDGIELILKHKRMTAKKYFEILDKL